MASYHDTSCYTDLQHVHQGDKQTYTELTHTQPGDSNVNYYELDQPGDQCSSQAPSLLDKAKKKFLQYRKKPMLQGVSLVLIVLLLGIIVLMILINTTMLITAVSEGTGTSAVVDDILQLIEEIFKMQNASNFMPSSCKDIKTVLPNSPTGYYHVNSRYIYCNMGELCGTGGGWTRLAYLDMSDSTVNCPTGFRLYQSGGVRACGRPVSSGGSCSSVQYPSNGVSYSQICGRVVGYQYGLTDTVGLISINDINSYYVDGVSITCGSPRQHVWTLMAGFQDSHYHSSNCPCNTPPGGTQQVQSFVGYNYFCESGNSNGSALKLYTGDPLWDGKGCGTQETVCCSAPGLPWFHRDYGNVTTTDYIELRVCGDQATSDEDVPVSFYEIYVK